MGMMCTCFRSLKSTARSLLALLTLGSLVGVANAVNMPFVLDSSTATLSNVNPQGDFYEFEGASSESGSGSGILDSLVGVDEGLGEYLQLTWAGNPKPFLTAVGLKAGGSDSEEKKGKKREKGAAANGLFTMLWDEGDLQLFNDSSDYDAIRIYQNGIVHKKHADHYLDIAHVAVDGWAGEEKVNVPDSGSAFAFLGIGVAILLVLKRTMKEDD